MGEWPIVQLGELADDVRRGTAPTYVESSGVLAIGQRCVTNEGFNPAHARPHDERVAGLRPKPGDVLLNSTGTGTIGRSCVFAGQGEVFIVDGHVTVVRPSGNRADGRYLNEVLRSAEGQRYLETRCFTGSTNQVELSKSELVRMPLPAPALEEQRRIAEILETMDETIQTSEGVIAKLDGLRVGMLDDLVAALAASTESSLSEVVSDPLCYGIVQVGEYFDGGIPVVAIRDLGGILGRGLHKVDPAIDARYPRSRVRGGEVLLSIKGSIGRVGLVPASFSGNISRDVALLRPVSGVEARFLKLFLESTVGQRRLARIAVGTTRAELSIHALRQLRIPVPSLEQQARAADVVDAMDERRAAEADSLQKLVRCRVGLAADLLSGRVRTVAA